MSAAVLGKGMPMGEITIGVDIGGTKIQAAAVRGGAVVSAHRIMTPMSPARPATCAMREITRPAVSALAQYAATKYALRAIADSLREEVNDKGVRVTSVYPGRTSSAMQAGVHAQEGRVYRPELLMQPDDVATVVMAALSLPRTAEMTDVSIRPMNKLS